MLRQNGASYPERIPFQDPPAFSVEALEIHFRITASILKYLELHEGKSIPNGIGKLFLEALKSSILSRRQPENTVQPPDESSIHVVTNYSEKLPTVSENANKHIELNSTLIESKRLSSYINDEKGSQLILTTSSEVKKCVEDLLTQVEINLSKMENVLSSTELSTNNTGIDLMLMNFIINIK